MSNTMEDSGAILREISSFKDMLDQVNEEIEKNIQRTREIESEILKLSEIEDGHIMRECELSKIITIRGFELEASIQVAAISRASAESMERESGSLKINRDIIEKRIYDKRKSLSRLSLIKLRLKYILVKAKDGSRCTSHKMRVLDPYSGSFASLQLIWTVSHMMGDGFCPPER
ncbi:uncharacterized protein LOC135582386 isoform X2 [Musa acuminata AAA Group]|uniref:uncharacterized protein LOC103988281 isoform X3 n=1 Tax=Musa acuminata AAA Group TaxID=214697 RepID=UPI0031E2124D